MSSSLNLDLLVLGQGLTLAQKLAIKNALIKIKLQEKKQDIRFWGKINGTQSDYFLALSTTISDSISKQFYWSNDEGATFSQLPAPDAFVAAKAPKIRGLFSGNPGFKHKDPDAPPPRDEDGNLIEEDEDEEEEEEEEQAFDEEEVDEDGNPIERPPPPRRLTELERLSFAVQQIEHDTGVVPLGSYYVTATGDILRNPAFSGLSLDDARKLSSFQLLRTPILPQTLAATRKAGVANHHGFLDTLALASGKAKHTWSVHASDDGLEVSLRSLLYPGFEYRLEAGTLNYQGGYMGTGEKNGDLLFML